MHIHAHTHTIVMLQHAFVLFQKGEINSVEYLISPLLVLPYLRSFFLRILPSSNKNEICSSPSPKRERKKSDPDENPPDAPTFPTLPYTQNKQRIRSLMKPFLEAKRKRQEKTGKRGSYACFADACMFLASRTKQK